MSFEDQQLSRWLAMAGVAKCKKQLRPAMLAKVKACECLVCGKPAVQRGLCWAHYLKFNRTRNALPVKDRVQFEQKQIEEGRVLASGQSREIRNPNPFAME